MSDDVWRCQCVMSFLYFSGLNGHAGHRVFCTYAVSKCRNSKIQQSHWSIKHRQSILQVDWSLTSANPVQVERCLTNELLQLHIALLHLRFFLVGLGRHHAVWQTVQWQCCSAALVPMASLLALEGFLRLSTQMLLPNMQKKQKHWKNTPKMQEKTFDFVLNTKLFKHVPRCIHLSSLLTSALWGTCIFSIFLRWKWTPVNFAAKAKV